MKVQNQLYQLRCVGLSHHTAPVDLREKLSFTAEQLAFALGNAPFDEIVILSTCNRLEVYASAVSYEAIRDYLAEVRQVCSRKLEPHLYRYSGTQVVRHLCQVAAGLDSMVLGEPQILGQVTAAYETAVAQQTSGSRLTALFRTALRAGKRARSETNIARNSVSVSSAAVALVSQHTGALANQRVAILGAGEMAQLALKNLVGRGVRDITLVNRRVARAASLASHYGVRVMGLDALAEVLQTADVLFTATSATHTLIGPDMVARAMSGRSCPLVLADLAVPRDIDPAVADLPLVRLFDVDDLRQQVDDALLLRQKEVPQVERIIQEELRRYAQKEREAAVRPLITDLHRQADVIRQRELARALRFLPDVDDAVRDQMVLFSQSLVKKLLHEPTKRLRAQAHEEGIDAHVESVRRLFALGDEAI